MHRPQNMNPIFHPKYANTCISDEYSNNRLDEFSRENVFFFYLQLCVTALSKDDIVKKMTL